MFEELRQRQNPGRPVTREQLVIEAIVELADTLVDGYDDIELLNRLVRHCVDLLAADAAGVLLADPQRNLRIATSSNEEIDTIELLQLQADQGPCVECFTSGVPVRVADLADASDRWPTFVAAVAALGTYRSVHALPLRLRGEAVGALSLFHRQTGALPEADIVLAQALADVATISILQERAIRRSAVSSEQLQAALDTRVVIEQAKGVLAQHGNLTMDTAFNRMRKYARDHNLQLSEVARQVVGRDLAAEVFIAHQPQRALRGRR
jgi:transcriptional regulator with GAF, ATPase, and Fis domain